MVNGQPCTPALLALTSTTQATSYLSSCFSAEGVVQLCIPRPSSILARWGMRRCPSLPEPSASKGKRSEAGGHGELMDVAYLECATHLGLSHVPPHGPAKPSEEPGAALTTAQRAASPRGDQRCLGRRTPPALPVPSPGAPGGERWEGEGGQALLAGRGGPTRGGAPARPVARRPQPGPRLPRAAIRGARAGWRRRQ